jgi:hypothetical protein
MIRIEQVAEKDSIQKGDGFIRATNSLLEDIQKKNFVLSVQYRVEADFWSALIVYADKEDREAINNYVGE